MTKRGRKILCGLAAVTVIAGSGRLSAASTAIVAPAGDKVDCVVTAATGEPKNPYKKPDGYYDQGTAGACVFTSLVNANISAGADDTGGKFMKRFRLCLFRKGRVNSWRRGVVVDSPEYQDMLRCKEEARAANTSSVAAKERTVSLAGEEVMDTQVASTEIKLKVIPETEPWATREQAICDALAKTPKGAATIVTKSSTTNHMSSVEKIDCAKNEMVIRDPNGGTYTITYDDTGKITGCTPANSLYSGATIGAVTVETTGP